MFTGYFAATARAKAARATAPATMSFTVGPDRYSAPPVETWMMPSLSASAKPRKAAFSVWDEVTLIAGYAKAPALARSSISAYTSGEAIGMCAVSRSPLADVHRVRENAYFLDGGAPLRSRRPSRAQPALPASRRAGGTDRTPADADRRRDPLRPVLPGLRPRRPSGVRGGVRGLRPAHRGRAVRLPGLAGPAGHPGAGGAARHHRRAHPPTDRGPGRRAGRRPPRRVAATDRGRGAALDRPRRADPGPVPGDPARPAHRGAVEQPGAGLPAACRARRPVRRDRHRLWDPRPPAGPDDRSGRLAPGHLRPDHRAQPQPPQPTAVRAEQAAAAALPGLLPRRTVPLAGRAVDRRRWLGLASGRHPRAVEHAGLVGQPVRVRGRAVPA